MLTLMRCKRGEHAMLVYLKRSAAFKNGGPIRFNLHRVLSLRAIIFYNEKLATR